MVLKEEGRIKFTSSKIDDLMFRTTFNPKSKKGDVIVNVSIVDSKDFNDVLSFFKMAVMGGLSLSPYLKIIHEGDSIEGLVVGKGKVGFATVCSITIDGVLLKAGIQVNPKFGGLVQVKKGTPIRFTDVLTYESTTIDPLEVLMSQAITSVTDVMRTGSGKLLANLREVPMVARDDTERILSDLVDSGFSGIMEVGEPNTSILDMPVERDHFGVVVIGGTNQMAIVQEQCIPIKINAMSTLVNFEKMRRIEELV
ncbi:MAG: DUF128 domain-containing protein [Methanosarcinaceae archaeon]|nr:DUF128 domain-containing protein [Methanosarcinaceae archaeon]